MGLLCAREEAARLQGFAGPSVIRKYVKDNPGYFPPPCGTTKGPTGRQISAFSRGDLQDFDRRRNGDNTGASGSPGGTTPEAVEQRIAKAVQHLHDIGGNRHGVAAELAAQHGGSERVWQSAVRQARLTNTATGTVRSARGRHIATPTARLHQSGHHRCLAGELATEHGEAARTRQAAIAAAREQLGVSH
ncbi:hypothetical protein ACWFR5_33330 [Streptomyces sp. NPDC055092]